MRIIYASSLLAAALVLSSSGASAQPLTTAFKFQGELRLNNVVVNQTSDFAFDLFAAPAGGASLGQNVRPNTPVNRGVFTVTLDFGAAAFDGNRRWVQIAVRSPSGVGSFTTLTPRVELTANPYALFALDVAANAVGAAELANNSVDSAAIIDGQVTLADLGAGSVTSLKVFDDSLTANDLATNSVGQAELADVSVDSAAIIDGQVTQGDLANGAVTSLKVFDNSLTQADLAPNAVGPSELADGSVDSAAIIDGSVTNADLAANIDADTVGGVAGGSFLRSDADDTIVGPRLYSVSGTSNTLTFGGANLVLNLGDSSADITNVGGPLNVTGDATIDGLDVFMGSVDAQKNLFFFDGGLNTTFLRWEDDTPFLLDHCTGSQLDSGFVWSVDDPIENGWAFANDYGQTGEDIEILMDELGNIRVDGSFLTGGACDVAESFLGPDGLEPGTLVRADVNQVESVVPTRLPYDGGMVGVVSTKPGLLLSGPTADAYPMWAEYEEMKRLYRLNPGEKEIENRLIEIERALDGWQRGNVDVALVGRVPVKVVGPVKAGQPLTSSAVPGHAMVLDRPGPSIGIALDDFVGEVGTVVVLVQPGWREPVLDGDAVTREEAGPGKKDVLTVFEQRLAALETLAGQNGAAGLDGRTGAAGATGSAGVDGTDSADGGAGIGGALPVVRLQKESWGDFDADGMDDVLVLNPGAPARLYRNLGNGRFADVTASANLGDTTGARMALWQDYDVDHRLDLLLVDAAGAAGLFQGAGTGTFQDVTGSLRLDFGQPIVAAEWLDYDHDSLPDLRVEIADGTLMLHHNLGHGAFEAVNLRSGSGAGGASDSRLADLENENAAMKARLAALEALIGSLGTGAQK